MMRAVIFIILLASIGTLPCEARFRMKKKPIKFLLQASGNYTLSNSEADAEVGATYSRKYRDAIALSGGAGVVISNSWYLGVKFEHWLAGRTFTVGGSTQTDTMTLQNVGAEIGIINSRDRLYLMLIGGVTYPLTIEVESTSGTFTTPAPLVGYYGKAIFGIRFSKVHSFYLQAGYRVTRISGLRNASSTDYLSGAAVHDLSGFFGGLGLQFEF